MILQGDCLEVLRGMEDGIVQTCVTSPPYYGLRDYGVDGQIGLEETPEAYVAKLVAVFREVRRVLKDNGTLWLNLGDSYNGSGKGGDKIGNEGKQTTNAGSITVKNKAMRLDELKPKDLLMIPARVALALQADGWYLRSEIVWHKPNPMPESVRDRPTKAHEMIYLLAKSQRYYYDADAILEPAVEKKWESRLERKSDKSFPDNKINGIRTKIKFGGNTGSQTGNPTYSGKEYVYTGTRNRRDVWTVTTKPYRLAHFATFPPDLIEPCVLAGSAVGDIVLDPFGGSGTTAEVAVKNGRDYIVIELNPAYIELTKERLAKVQLKCEVI
jgi:DNA modification methylase